MWACCPRWTPSSCSLWSNVTFIFMAAQRPPPTSGYYAILFIESQVKLNTNWFHLKRLIMQLMAAAVLSLVYFIPSDLAIILLLSGGGYLLSSIDFIYLFGCLWRLRTATRSVIIPVSNSRVLLNEKPSNRLAENVNSNEFPFSWKDWVYHTIMLCLTVLSVLVVYLTFQAYKVNEQDAFYVQTGLLYCGLGLFLIVKVCGDLQRVYVCFGLFRNPFYSQQCLSSSLKKEQKHSLNENKPVFKMLKFTRLVLIKMSKIFQFNRSKTSRFTLTLTELFNKINLFHQNYVI